jgi:hypothetical protein
MRGFFTSPAPNLLNNCSALHEITAFFHAGAQNVSDRTFSAIFLLHAGAGLPRMRAT